MSTPLTAHEKVALSALYEHIRRAMMLIESPTFDAPIWLTEAAGKGLAYHRRSLKEAEKNSDFLMLRHHMKMAAYSLPEYEKSQD